VAIEATKTKNGFEIKKRVLVTNVPKVVASFLLNTWALPTAAGLEGGSPCLQPSIFRSRQQWSAPSYRTTCIC